MIKQLYNSTLWQIVEEDGDVIRDDKRIARTNISIFSIIENL